MENATKQQASPSRRAFLKSLSRRELIGLIEDLAQRQKGVAADLDHRVHLSLGSTEQLKRKALRAMQPGSRPSRRNNWADTQFCPDYQRVRSYLRRLLEEGEADAVVELGGELIETGYEVVEQIDDEGETASQIADCMKTVVAALTRSSLPVSSRMLWMIHADLKDDFGFLEGCGSFWTPDFSASEWRKVAVEIQREIEEDATRADSGFGDESRRERLGDWLIEALESAGQAEEALSICKREAELTGSYVRLVERLCANERLDEAREWIEKGIRNAAAEDQGMARRLREMLIEILENEERHLPVVSLLADLFFLSPSLDSYRRLEAAARQIGVWPTVRTAALRFLETGALPIQESWPLPNPEVPTIDVSPRDLAPFASLLTEIAIAENRLEDALRWYDQRSKERDPWNNHPNFDLKIAGAVVGEFPNRALDIWKQAAEREISYSLPTHYEIAAGHLRKVKRVLEEAGREREWATYLAEIRSKHGRKRRLMQILDGLQEADIVTRP